MSARDMKCYGSQCGSRVHKLYAPRVEKDGRVSLVETGVEDLQDFIQSHRESCDIQTIMKQVQRGQVELLSRRPGSYGDFTTMPKTFAEVLQLQIDAGRLFEALPPEVRLEFGNDRDVFLATAGTEDWAVRMKSVLPDEVFSAVAPKAAAVAAQTAAVAVEKGVKDE